LPINQMMRTLKQRVLVTLAATLLAGMCGKLLGYLVGCALAIHIAQGSLESYATRALEEAKMASAESRALLATMNASQYAFCSDAEIAWYRTLIYRSEYLKEAGRMHDGKVYCSATLGRLDQPILAPAPDFSQQDGTKVYKRFTPFQMGDLNVVSLQLRDSYVVFSPFPQLHREFPPIHYTSTGRNDPSQQPIVLVGVLQEPSWQVLTTDGDARVADTLYATRCSSQYFNCVTDYISIADALRTGHRELTACVILGGVGGALFGFFLSLVYRRSRSMEQQLRRAIAGNRLRLEYQPIVNLEDRRIVGAEALSRWTDEDGLPVGPDVFIKLAEERGFVGAITELVVRNALREMGETLRNYPDFQLSINVAAADLADPRFLPMLDRAVEQAGVSPRRLAIEITESSTVQYQAAMETIRLLRQNGYSVHIDDFGTGYSSLSYLHDLSIDAIKIDRSFTRAIGTGSVIGSILPQILSMAGALHLGVIVEGIETGEQAAYFAHAQIRVLGQGWLYGHPVPADEFIGILIDDEMRELIPLGAA
jgi:sensor c-di-GMP phosphodiesterase-like protein